MSRRHRLYIGILLLAIGLLTPISLIHTAEAAPPPGCSDILVNGDFEGSGGWWIHVSPATAAYVPAPNRPGSAIRLGITEVPNRYAYSSIEQTVTIPANAVSAELRWDFLALAEGPADADRQQLIILDPMTRHPIEILWDVRRNDGVWLTAATDLTIYRGQTIILYFNVFNDGNGAVDETTAMYLDNVELEVCIGTTATPTTTTPTPPTATPTATPTPTPTDTPTAGPNVRITFIEFNPPGPDIDGEYAQIENQGGTPVTMTGWTLSDEAGNTFTFPAFTLNAGASVKIWTKSGSNTATDLYWGRGQAVWNNDGDIAYLRDSSSTLIDTYSYMPGATPTPISTPTPTPVGTSPPTPTPVQTPTPAPTPTPTIAPPTATPIPGPTPPVGACVEQLLNGGFETDAGWQLHPTLLWPTYVGSPHPVHSGARSVMLGNPLRPDALSYSSVRQAVTIPPDAQTARIEFWYWAQSDDLNGGDRQELLLLDPVYYTRIADLWRPRPLRDERSWQHMTIDLTPYRGQWVLIYFNVFNDGDGQRTSMFLDDVSLLACWPVTPTAISLSTTPATPAPTSGAISMAPEATPTAPTPTPARAFIIAAAAPDTLPAPTAEPAVTRIAVEELETPEEPERSLAVPLLLTPAPTGEGSASPRWPIIVGILLGVIILAALVIWWTYGAPVEAR